MREWQITAFFGLYLLAMLMTLGLAWQGWQMRRVRPARLFAGLMVATTAWLAGYTLGFFNTGLQWKLGLLRLEYLGMIATNFMWLYFVTSYTGYEGWLRWRNLVLLAIIPVLTYLQILTVEQHTLFYQRYQVKEVAGLIVSDKIYGPGFYLWTFYSYGVTLMGCYMLLRSLQRMPTAELRRRVAIPLLVVLLVVVPNVFYISGHNPIAPYDPIALSFAVVGLLFFIAIRQMGLLRILPVAHHLIFKNVQSGVLILNEQGAILGMNPLAEQILQTEQATIIGQSLLTAFPQHEALIRRFAYIREVQTEIELGTNGQIYDLRITAFTNHWDKPLGWVILLHDITALKQTEAALRQTTHELAEQNRELDAFAHTVAHDLKTPLAALTGFSKLLTQRAERWSPEKIQATAQQIAQIGDKMASIVDALLLLASVRQSDSVVLQPLDSGPIVQEVRLRLAEQIRTTKAVITLSPPPWPTAIGYAPWVEEVWVNYLSNALKYGGSPPQIVIGATACEQTGAIHFWVKDNGAGLSPAQQAQVFERFTRFHPELEGHGLGLSIVKRIVERLGGEVGVESAVGKGSTFSFTLPAA